ncbi:hypothetical protein [Romeriopsis navalis]|nr:hypothetical protein [Romeriopsis navalis]
MHYVQRQYIGNVGKRENGIVAVTAYALDLWVEQSSIPEEIFDAR